MLASLEDSLVARHAIFPPQRTNGWEERLRNEPKDGLRGRLYQC